MSTTLSAALAAQAVLATVMLVFATRAWFRVRDLRTCLLATAFFLLLVQTIVLVVAAAYDLLDLESAVTIGTFVELAALLALYMGILRR